MKDFLKNFPFRDFSVFITIVGSFTYNILLDRDVVCTCIDVAEDCYIYLLLPAIIIFLLILWTDKTLQRTCKYYIFLVSRQDQLLYDQPAQPKDTKGCGKLCGVFWICIFKGLCVGVLWPISVFIDGEWFVCCRNDHSETQSWLACKDKTNITAEEKVIIGTLKNKSRVSFVLFFTSFIFLNTVLSQQTLLKL